MTSSWRFTICCSPARLGTQSNPSPRGSLVMSVTEFEIFKLAAWPKRLKGSVTGSSLPCRCLEILLSGGALLMHTWVHSPKARAWIWGQNQIAYIVCIHVTHKAPPFFHNSSQRVWFSFPNTVFSGGQDELLNTSRTLRSLPGKWKQSHCTEKVQPRTLQIPAFQISAGMNI